MGCSPISSLSARTKSGFEWLWGCKPSRGSASCCPERNADDFAGLSLESFAALGLTRLLAGLLFGRQKATECVHIRGPSRPCCAGLPCWRATSPPAAPRASIPSWPALRVRAHVTAAKPVKRTPLTVRKGTGRGGVDEELRGFLEMAAEEKMKQG